MVYELTCVNGETFLLSLGDVRTVLKGSLCESCIMGLPEYFSEMSVEDQVEELLWTQCGAEWILETI